MKPKLGTFRHSAISRLIRHSGPGRKISAACTSRPSCTLRAQEKFDRGPGDGAFILLSGQHPSLPPKPAAAIRRCAIAYWGIAISSRPTH